MRRSVVLIVGAGCLTVGLAVAATVGFNSGGSAPMNQSSSVHNAAGTSSGGPTASETSSSGGGMAAIARAREAGKYLFVLFWKTDDEATLAMRSTLAAALKRASARAESAAVKITEADERPLVEKFGLERAPMPLILAMAPNGAVTGGFPTKVEEQTLLKAFATPCTERCMKALQDGKLVLLCVQNATTQLNAGAMQGVRAFKDDARFGHATEIVMLDPADQAEAEFLANLKVDPRPAQAVTAFLVPPGAVVAKLEGATTKDHFVDALQKANASCGPGGCGPGGCGPKK